MVHLGEREDTWSQRTIEYAHIALEHGVFAGPLGVRILVENLLSEATTPQHLVSILELGHLDNVGVCLDLGHANITVGTAEAITTLGSRIASVHVHDNHGLRTSTCGPVTALSTGRLPSRRSKTSTLRPQQFLRSATRCQRTTQHCPPELKRPLRFSNKGSGAVRTFRSLSFLSVLILEPENCRYHGSIMSFSGLSLPFLAPYLASAARRANHGQGCAAPDHRLAREWNAGLAPILQQVQVPSRHERSPCLRHGRSSGESLSSLITALQFDVYLFDKNKARVGDDVIEVKNVSPGETVKFETTVTTSGTPVLVSIRDMSQAPRTITLTVNSTPQGAVLKLDGVEQGPDAPPYQRWARESYTLFHKRGIYGRKFSSGDRPSRMF